MENYIFSENLLLHSIGFDVYKLYSILTNGIVSKQEAEKENISYSRNYFGYNFDNYISMTRYMYVNKDDENSAYKKYALKGISFIVEDQDFIYNTQDAYFNYSDEVFVKDKVELKNIKGIIVPEKYMDYEMKDLPIISFKSTSYVNIKHTTDNIIKYLKFEGYNCDLEYYNDILREMYTTIEAIKKEPEDQDLLNDFNDTKYDLDEYISLEIQKCFCKKFGVDNVTLGDVINYINSKTCNLPIYKLPTNYNVR